MTDPIKISDKMQISESIKLRFIHSASYFFPIQLKILDTCRTNAKIPNEVVAANLLTITSMTAFIEAIINENFNAVIEKQKLQEGNIIATNLIKYFEESTSGATFKNYEQISQDILGMSLSKFTTNEIWESIKTLFALRNQIVHGRDFSVDYTHSDDDSVTEELGKNYKQIVHFLQKKKLLEKGSLSLDKVLSNQVTNYFIEITKTFFIDLTKNMSEKFGTSTYTNSKYLRTELGFD